MADKGKGKGKGDEEIIESGGPSAKAIGLGVLAVVLVVFVLSNLETATVQFLTFDVEMSLAVALGAAALVGLVVGYIFGRQAGRAKRRS